ncbi:hypothetical protein [Thermovirga lienii]|uniref:hypothetical protein n=1 Tax=Thermovirga lienii TaxID=336261 RepID=UPI002FDF81BC
MKIRHLICLVLLLSLLVGGKAYASDTDDYGPIDLYDTLKTAILKSDEQLKAQLREDGDRTFWQKAIFANQWLITRALTRGVDNVDEAISLIQGDPTLLKDVLLSYLYAAVYLEADRKEEIDKVADMTPEEVKAKLEEYGLLAEKAESFQAFGSFLAEAKPYLLDKPIFDRMATASLYLLFLFMVIRLGFGMYKIVVGNDARGSHELFTTIIKTGLIFIIIFHLKSLIFGGIHMSDALRNMIVNKDIDIGDLVTQMLHAKMALANIDPDVSLWGVIRSNASAFLTNILGAVAFYIAAATLFILMLLGDVMMAITAIVGPLVFVLSLLPSCEGYIGRWVRGCFTFLLYGPLAAVYAYILIALLAIGLDTSPLIFIVICVAYVMGATRVPNIAESLSGVVLTGMAVGLAMGPASVGKSALTQAAAFGGGKAASKIGSMLNKN